MKNKILFTLLLAFFVFVSFYYGSSIKSNALLVNDKVSIAFHDVSTFTKDWLSKFFNQANEIEFLRAENQRLEQNAMLASTFASQLNLLLEDRNLSQRYEPKVSLVRSISYVQLGDYHRVWLEADLNTTNNKGLIYKGYTAGIAVLENGRVMGILQGDKQCIFSVYIGEAKVSGVVQGQKDKLFVKFIPKHSKINIGDEVLTSGLDGVFFSGVPVGRVVSISQEDMYQSAELEPFTQPEIPSYFYIVESF